MNEENLDRDTMEAIWLPPKLKKGIERMARVENHRAVWRYIATLHNNFVIAQDEKSKK